MEKLALIAVLLAATSFPAVQAQTHTEGNPFARLGYKASVYTFGDKKEFHDLETIVEIGNVLYNTKTKEVVGFVEDTDTLIELRPELQSMSIDPLCEKYYSVTPYAYCMNNPVRYVDLKGDSLTLAGSTTDIQATANVYNIGLGGFYTTSADTNGKMSISSVAGTDLNTMTTEQKAYYTALNKVISGTNGMTTINVQNGTSVVIGDVHANAIDIGDIQALGNGTDVNQGSALLHETIEQYGIQINGQNVINAHRTASGVERTVTGSYVNPFNRDLVGGQLNVPVLDPATSKPIKTVIIYVNNAGNVTGIKR